jgi:hypothetical protein
LQVLSCHCKISDKNYRKFELTTTFEKQQPASLFGSILTLSVFTQLDFDAYFRMLIMFIFKIYGFVFQLVVEMRSAEVRQLREERLKLLDQLEAFETTRNILEKMNARVEDLQAQLEAKSQVER